MRVAIIGGGSTAHLLGALLTHHGHNVRVLTSRPLYWQHELLLRAGHENIMGRIDVASADPEVVIEGAQVAFLCMPVHQYINSLKVIMPALAKNPECIVGPMYGQGGFDWMIKYEAKRLNVPVPRHFVIGLLPWITRTINYGHESVYYGSNVRNTIATSSPDVFDYLSNRVLDDLGYTQWGCGKFEYVPNILTLTLTVDNQIIHPSRCYTLWTSGLGWETQGEVPYFYRDWDERSSQCLAGVDEDYVRVRATLFRHNPTLESVYNLDWLALQDWTYAEKNTGITSFFRDAESLRYIHTPVMRTQDNKLKLDVEHRFFKDDFAFGLEICAWLADQMKCDVPHISCLIDWYRKEISPLQKAAVCSGVPSSYGMRLEELI